MKRQIQLGAFTLTFAGAMEAAVAQTATAALPPASAASHQPNPAPGGGVTWFVAGLVVGLVVGYMVGKNAKPATASSSP